MNADDDGFCEHFTVMRMTDSKPDDLRILQAKGYVHVFDDKVLVILQWKENNYLRNDRYSPSKYLKIYHGELLRLSTGIPNGDSGKDRIGKDRIGESRAVRQISSAKIDKIPDILAAVMSDDLRASLSEWIESRKGTKTPVTAQALTLGISELERLYPSDYDKQVRCVNQTVISGWRGFFELRNSQAGTKKKASSYPDLDAPKVGA